MKRPLLVVGAAAGGLLLTYLLWKLLVATSSATGLLGSGYQADYKVVSSGHGEGLEVIIRSLSMMSVFDSPRGVVSITASLAVFPLTVIPTARPLGCQWNIHSPEPTS